MLPRNRENYKAGFDEGLEERKEAARLPPGRAIGNDGGSAERSLAAQG
jgi:hypothetical protein